MITLQPVNESNFLDAAALRVHPEQTQFVTTSPMILARAYAYRSQRAACWGIYAERELIGLAMIHDMEEEPACYHLCEFMIDAKHQGKGYGQKALTLLLEHCRREGKFSNVEVCVKKENTSAIHVYEKEGFRDTGYVNPDAPDNLCMVYDLTLKKLDICLTGREDLKNVQALWADPAVMHFVGFPEGLHETMEHLETEWLPWVQCPPKRQHYSVYAHSYCGETFYNVDDTGLACMDIKLLPAARGKGIAYRSLSYALDAAFREGCAKAAYVDPDPENHKALSLYRRLGFVNAERPAHLEDLGCPYVYLELSRENWLSRQSIHYRDIILRDMRESDIEDWIRWYNEETQWGDWDAPDEEMQPVNPDEFRAKMKKMLESPRQGFRSFFEMDTAWGDHIGAVSSYAIDDNFRWMSWKDAHACGKFYHTLGLDICDSRFWGKGLGTQALTAFAKHFLDNGKEPLCLQTWSGNERMIRCAEKIGFVEWNRFVGNRRIRGGIYDSLTFKLDIDRFHKYLSENA